MKALIAFVIMTVLILTLIEINERRKKASLPPTPQQSGESLIHTPSPVEKEENMDTENAASEEAACNDPEDEDCSACELIAVCEKKDNGASK